MFQIGKQGVGYLLRASDLDGTAASPAFQTPVCNGSFGGAVSSGGVIYVACSDGMRALALDTGTPSIAPLATWKVTSAAIGPPIVAGGLVWAVDWSHGTLYGFSPQTGQAVVRESTPAMEHFASPAASDGKLFLATGQTVQAYTIATPAPPVMAPTAPAPPPPKCVLRLRTRRVKIHHPKRRGQRNHRATFGTVSLVAKCNQTATVTLSGIVTERLSKKPRHGRARTRIIHLAKMRATLPAGAAKTLQLRLAPAVMRALERRIRTSASFTLTGGNAGGTSRARAHARLSL